MEKKIAPLEAKDNPPVLDKNCGSHPAKRICSSISELKIFLGALAFCYFAKAFSGSYMKSMSTQIERRFEISSSVVGLIDGGFEIGNLMVLVLVSYLGPKIHRPKAIAIGCIIMSIGTFISVVPHFIMGRYNYKSIAVSGASTSGSISACNSVSPSALYAAGDAEISGNSTTLGCGKVSGSYLWLFVLIGNILRGIGEAPVIPLGMTYIDDFAREENSAFYIGAVRSAGMLGPTLGFVLGAVCANLWVDIGVVDAKTLLIDSKDIRWVGAWWLGFLICGATSIAASFPFWFLPRSLQKQGEDTVIKKKASEVNGITKESDGKMKSPAQQQLKISEELKDFFPTVKKLLGNPIFLVYLLLNILQYNSLVGIATFESKFMEQQFDIPVSKAMFLIGVIVLPITIVPTFLGGFIVKKFKLQIMGMAKFTCITFLSAYLFNLLYFVSNCEVLQVAGLTVNYSGIKEPSFLKEKLLSTCNSDCKCDTRHWDPVCGDNGITYMSACLAGCRASVKTGMNTVNAGTIFSVFINSIVKVSIDLKMQIILASFMISSVFQVFHNCSCVEASELGNFSAVLGQCPRNECSKVFPYFLAFLSLCVLLLSLGGTPMYMTMFRLVSPDLKSFAVGIETVCGRIFGGLPAPIYFGALIDTTCLKWGIPSCGGSGSCRLYNTKAFRNVYVGLITALRGGSCLLYIVFFILIMRRFRHENKETMAAKVVDAPSKQLPATDQNTSESSSMEMSANEDTHL